MTTVYSVGLTGSNETSWLNAVRDMEYVIDVRALPWSQAVRNGPAYAYHGETRLKELLGDRYRSLPGLGIKSKGARDQLKKLNQATMDVVLEDLTTRKLVEWNTADLAYVKGLVDAGYKVALLCQEQVGYACHRRYLIEHELRADLVELDARK